MRSVDPDDEPSVGPGSERPTIVEAPDPPILNSEAAGVLALIVRSWIEARGNCHRGEQDSVA